MMQPRRILIFVLVATLATAGAITGSANTDPRADPVTESGLLATVTVPNGILETQCGGEAPADDSCTTGAHLLLTGSASHGLPGQLESYTGTLESTVQTLAPVQQERVLRCDYEDGDLVGCTSSGLAPPNYAVFLHTCASYEFGTTNPGGDGAWRCYVDY